MCDVITNNNSDIVSYCIKVAKGVYAELFSCKRKISELDNHFR